MKSITAASGGIAFKIWILALLTNTIGGSFMLGGLGIEFFMFAMIGGFFGLIFSFPIFLIIWKILYQLFKKGYSYSEVFWGLMLAGGILAALAYGVFAVLFNMAPFDGASLAILAIVSGCTGIVLSQGSIKKYCSKKDEEEVAIEQIGRNETENNYAS